MVADSTEDITRTINTHTHPSTTHHHPTIVTRSISHHHSSRLQLQLEIKFAKSAITQATQQEPVLIVVTMLTTPDWSAMN